MRGSGPSRRLSWLTLALAALLFVPGCQRYEEVEVLKKPEDILAARKAKQQKASSEAQRRPARPAPGAQRLQSRPTPEPTPAKERKSLVLLPASMKADNGTTDSEGGWVLFSNGHLHVDNMKIDFPVGEVLLEMKGDPAHDIWPEVHLNLFHNAFKRGYRLWGRDYVTTSTYFEYRKPVEPPLPAGEYLVSFRYFNNAVPSDSKQDRNVYLRKIILLEPE